MARTQVNHQQVVVTGLESTYVAAHVDGNKFANDGQMIVRVVNANIADRTLTIQTPGTVDGLAIAERTVVITAGETREIGPFPPGIYNQSDGMVYLDWSAISDVTLAVLRI